MKENHNIYLLLKRKGMGILFLVIGCLSLLYGIHRNEHKTVEQKSNMICLECIGIG